ncbi:MAG: HD domain-containing protein [Betaproteobacteria bacterium]|nr:HD domain-containing protein [Betaproteobacteria bacterium]
MGVQTIATPADGGAESITERLAAVEAQLAGLDREALHAALAPLIAELARERPVREACAAVVRSLTLVRRLFTLTRSADAIPLARAAHALAARTGDPGLERRAARACGNVLGDAGDLVTAIEYNLENLHQAAAEGNRVEMALAWCNIGVTFSAAGNYALAAPAFRRAIEQVENLPSAGFALFAPCSNLASASYHLRDFEEGLVYARLAEKQLSPAIRQEDPQAELLLHRNLVNLLVATGSVAEAEHHALEAGRLAQAIGTPRAAVAAAVARATWEVATGRHEFALTRLDKVIETSRGLPATLRETLVCAIRAEESAGNPERALMRMQELSDHIYRAAIERVKNRVELERLFREAAPEGDAFVEQERARLTARIEPPREPGEWKALERMAQAAALRFDPTARHGERVGALTQALAAACGIDPLRSLEIGLASRLHDIGMASVPEGIAAGHAPRNPVERRLYLRHAEAGGEMLNDAHHPRLLLARDIAHYHHAHWDGTGHPEHVGGRAIPRPARLCAVADTYDALVCGDGAQPACSMDEALAVLARGAGTLFDPEIVPRFDAMIREQADELGLDTRAAAGVDAFGELVTSLQEDRGFL